MLACSFDRRRGGCFLRAMDGLTFKWWQMKLGSTPRALQASYAKTSAFSLRNSISSSFSRGGSSKPTWKNFSGSTSMATLSRFSHFTSSVGSSLGNGSVVNCYNPSLVDAKGPTTSWREMAATMHCLAIVWSSTISITWPFDGYFTFWCNVEEIAPRA